MHTQLQRHKFNLFPKASEEDFARLLDDMRANGYDATMPITLYQGAILDGWNRYCAAIELGLTPATVQFDGDDGAALEYTLRTNKRRNMSSSQWATVAVEAEEIRAAIQAQVEAQRRAKQAATQAEPVSQLIDEQPARNEDRTDHKVAEVFNTNRTYINEAAKLKETSPETFEMVKAGEVSVPLASQFAALPQEVQQEAIAAIAEHHEPAKEVMREAVKNHRAIGTGENEWYTPAEYVELAREVMGGIDLDPASCAQANEVVGAATFYTKEDDGLSKDWAGRLWLNPPYSRDLMPAFVEKLRTSYMDGEVGQAVLVSHNNTDTAWFHSLAGIASAICFPKKRIRFYRDAEVAAPTNGQAFFYLGDDPQKFISTFESVGFVVRPA